MIRDVQRHSGSGQRKNRSNSMGPILVATGLFAIVMGTLFYMGRPANTVKPTDTSTNQNEVASKAAQEAKVVAQPAAAIARPKDKTDDAPVVAAAPAAKTPAVQNPAVERSEKVNAQLASGEFGPALETARQASNAAEQTQLLKQVAKAQMDAGDFEAAAAAIRRMPIPQDRSETSRENASRSSLAGGQANFGPLISLIQQETGTPDDWSSTGGEGGNVQQFQTGVLVDPAGLLTQLTREEQNGILKSLGVEARNAGLNEDMAAESSLRLVSLTRLEKEVAKRLAEGKPVLETMKHLAGLSEIQYIFVYPEEREIVIGGPAEGWKYNATGLPVGVNSGRPTLQLDDFVTVLRTFTAGGQGAFDCLIVPREAGLKEVKQFVESSQSKGPLNPGSVGNWVNQLQQKLGQQDIEVSGIPTDSRVARVIVEADYRMKLIGVGKMSAGSNIPSYFDLLKTTGQTSSQSIDALRWWMTLKCDSVQHSPNRDVFALQGTSVLCLSENELITNQGKRVHTGQSEATNSLFAANFTKHFADLTAKDPVFADLENIFDLSLVAALIEQERLADRIDWNLGVFSRNGFYRPTEYAPAETVISVVNHRVYNGKDIVVQVAGGVRGDVMSILKNAAAVQVDRLASMVSRGKAPQLPEGRWWWDAAK